MDRYIAVVERGINQFGRERQENGRSAMPRGGCMLGIPSIAISSAIALPRKKLLDLLFSFISGLDIPSWVKSFSEIP
jgi:hypothetical protein